MRVVPMIDFVSHHYVTSGGLRLAADIGGAPDAPAIILMHGGGQTRHSWVGAMRQMIAEGYHVINLDARGHGESDWAPDGDYSLDARASDLGYVASTLRQPVAVVGASMGGATSFYAVGNGNVKARALVMVDIVLRPAKAGAEKIRKFMRANLDGFASIEEAAVAVAAYNPDRPRPSDPSGLMRNLRLKENGRLYWHWDPRIMDEQPSAEPPAWVDKLLEVSSGVDIPTLVVRGGHSDVVDDEGLAEMLDLVPQTEIYDVSHAGHMVVGDKNDAFNRGVLEFLGRNFSATIASA